MALVWLTANPTTNPAFAKIATRICSKNGLFTLKSAENLLDQRDQGRDKGGIGEEFEEVAEEGYKGHRARFWPSKLLGNFQRSPLVDDFDAEKPIFYA